MSKKIFKQSELPVRETYELLPEIFKSPTNRKFLSATLDPLVQPGTLDRLSGYIGRNYGRTYNSKDVYLDKELSLRHAYQLEPGVVITDPNNDSVTDFYDYLDVKSQLRFFNNTNERDDLTTGMNSYSWNPPIEWDKFINYREYYWLPQGPDTVSISGQAQDVESEYRVRSQGENEFIFFPDGLTPNPGLTLYRGQTYNFQVNTPGDPFYIRRNPTEGSIADYNDGVTNNGAEVGTVSITIPVNSPDVLYYQSGNNIDRVGMFRISSIDENTKIDVELEIVGKTHYTSSNNIKFTNGLKVSFTGQVTPEKYASGEWLVDGVGDSITLISFQDLDLPPVPNDDVDVLFDDGGWDTLPFDDAVSFPSNKDYITINRNSKDRNPWSRYNKWFHREVIDYSASINNVASKISESSRAKRPIIEFKSNLQLINHCSVAKKTIDFIDDFTKDVFSTIEGTAGYNIDNIDIFEGARILFTADTDPLVQNKIFVVKKIAIQDNNIANNLQIALVEADDADTQAGEGVIVKFGKTNAGLMYHFNGERWVRSQSKTSVNQSPRFDIFDEDGTSFSDILKYETSSFTGSSLLSYKVGSGANDTELGFPIAYQNLNNSGDIVFESNWDVDQFTYQVNANNLTKKINTGYIKTNNTLEDFSYHNLYILSDSDFDQAILQTYTLPEDSSEVTFSNVDWNSSLNSKLYFYNNGEFINEDYTIVSTVEGLRTFSFTNKIFNKDDTVTLKVFSDDEPNLGFYEFPKSLERNPLNSALEEFTLGQATDHLRSMVNYTQEFTGQFPGISNLRDLEGYQNKGQRFVKYSSVAATSLPLLCDKENNIVKSLRYSAKQYENYKSNILKQAVVLPFGGEDVVSLLDDILIDISETKPDNSAFSNTDMLGSGANKVTKYTVEDTGIKTFALSENFDLDTPSTKAVYLYLNGNQLIHGIDYEFDSEFGFVRITRDFVEDDELEIKEYYSTSFNFVPETPTSLGLYKSWIPEIYTDTSYARPRKVIRGHDGSITIGFNDFRDDLLLEFEKRIYNNIKQKYNPEILDIDSLFGGYENTGIFTKQQVDSILELEFLRWPLTKGIDLYDNSYYDPNNQFTWTFNKTLDVKREQTMPRYWRGVYTYLFDTVTPHLTPWEMLGFTNKPTWWEDEYGAAPYTSNNLILWEDLRDGVIKQGERKGTHLRYQRASLLDYLPVDADGNLLTPLESDVFIDFTTNYQDKFKFGDISPSESAWRRSSSYPYSKIIAACLLRPFEVISLNLDRKIIKKNKVNQFVSTATNTFINVSDVVSSLESNTRPDGLLAFVINYLKSNARTKDELYTLYNNFDIKLSTRIKGFVDKEQQQYLLDSKNPQSKQTGVFLPKENYQIFFNISSPQFTTRYSGVLVEKVVGGYKVSGYDQLNAIFKYYPFFAQQNDPVLDVGGVSEAFVDWTPGSFYIKGTLVKYQNSFYRSILAHEADNTFESNKWKQVEQVPTVGGAKAIKRTRFDSTTELTFNYDTVLETTQQVVDFLLGYEKFLEDQGMVFDVFNKDLGNVQNWETSVREFLFWTTHNWAEGSILSMSPGATLLKFQNIGAVADNILDSFYDYNILRADGTKIDAEDIDVFRGENELLISPEQDNEGIYFAEINYVQKEHVTIFDDKTVFNDIIFDKGPGYRQERIKSKGFRTVDWDGDYTSPGFIFDNVNILPWKQYQDYRLGDIVQYKQYNYVSKSFQKGTQEFKQENWSILDSNPTSGLVPNFDFRVNQIEDYYELSIDGINSAQKTLAKHTVGFQQRDYLQEIAEDDVAQFKLFQGFSREKGSNNAIKKVFDKVSTVDDDKIVLNEEWAFRMGAIGGTAQIEEAEFDLKANSFKLNPQPVLLNGNSFSTVDYQNYILLKDSDYQIGNTNFNFPLKTYTVPENSAGYIFNNDVEWIRNNLFEFLNNDIPIENLKNNDNVWTTFEPGSWNVYRYVISSVLIDDVVAPDVDRVELITNRVHNFQVGQIVGINNISGLTGFYQISAVEPTKIIIAIAGFKDAPEIDQSTFSYVSYFESVRVASYEELVDKGFAKLPVGSKVFIDNSEETNGWEVVQRNKQYDVTQISEYGIAFPTGTGSAVTFVPELNQTIVGNPGAPVTSGDVVRDSAVIVYSDGESGLIPLQILTPKEGLQPSYLGAYAEVITASDDGRWLIVGSPSASNIPSNYQEVFDSNANYEPGDTVLYAGKLYKATRRVFGDGSTIDLGSQDWQPVELLEANPLGADLFLANKGYSRQGGVDIYEYSNGQWILKNSLVSPRQAHGEKFGSSITIGKLEGIEGTSGDVTLTVNEIDNSGGIISVKASGSSGLNDEIFENVSGIDISSSGQNATFDITRTSGTSIYDINVRNGGEGYAVGDKLYIQGIRVGGQPATGSSNNDIIITVKQVDENGSILGAGTFNNVTGITSTSVSELALFTVTKNKDVYNVRLRQDTTVSPAVPVQAGDGYKSRSIVRFNGFFYACIQDTGFDKGVWKATSTYDSGDVVKYPENSSQYWNVLKTVTGVEPGSDITAYSAYQTIFPNTSPEYWEQVAGFPFNVAYDANTSSPTYGTGNWVDWDEKDNKGNLIPYTPGTTIVIPGNIVGGKTPENDINIFINQVSNDGDVGPFPTKRQGEIQYFSYSGIAAIGVEYEGIPGPGSGTFLDVTPEDASNPGTGAIFDIERKSGAYSASISVAGSGYVVGDQIKILGTDLGATDESYYMSISAPGSRDDRGKVYLYQFNGTAWTFLQDKEFVGIFDINRSYVESSIVWYQNSYYKATQFFTADGILTPLTSNVWEATNTVNKNIIPNVNAYVDDGSSLEQGTADEQIENIDIGDKFGYSTTMSKNGDVLVSSSPYADTNNFENYRGVWRSTETYIQGDVVRRNNTYYELDSDSSLTSINDAPEIDNKWIGIKNTNSPRTGVVFVYKKNENKVYNFIQEISKNSIPSLKPGDAFGEKVVLSKDGQTLFVGSPNADKNEKDQGSVFVFAWSGNNYVFKQRIQSNTTDYQERFGSNISISPDGKTLVVSAEGAQTFDGMTFDSNQTKFDRLSTTFADPLGNTGKVFVFNEYGGRWVLGEIFEDDLNTNEDFGRALATSNNTIIVGSPKYLSNDPAFSEVVIGRIQKFEKDNNVNPWEAIRKQEPQVDVSKIKNLAAYEKDIYKKIADIDLIDYYKDKLLGIVEQNIDFKTPFDPAVYSQSTNEELTTKDEGQHWGERQVGEIWWDTSKVKYLVYEQGDVVFRNGNWNAFAQGSSIDVYQWVESSLTPSRYAQETNKDNPEITGTPLYPDDTAYSVKQNVNPINGNISSTKYYFWVKNKFNQELNSTKTLAASQVADYIQNPQNAGVPFAYIIDKDKITISNLKTLLNSDDFSVNIQYYKTDDNLNLIHNEYLLATESSKDDPNEELERKWIDSLVGSDILGNQIPDPNLSDKNKYGTASRPRQTIFVNRNKAVEQTITFINDSLTKLPLADEISYEYLNLIDEKPSFVKNLYDVVIDTEAELRLQTTANIKQASLSVNIINGHINTIEILDAGFGYKRPPQITITGDGEGALAEATIDSFGRVVSVTVTNQGKKYLNATPVVRPYSVLVEKDSTVNGFWSIYAWSVREQQFYRTSTQEYDTTKYWETIDWWENGYSEESRISQSLPGLYAELEVSLNEGQLLRLDDYGSGGWAVLERVSESTATIINKYRLVGRQSGTIRVINKFYDTPIESTGYDQTQTYDSNRYDTSSAKEFRNILNAMKYNVFVDELDGYWNKLFFINIHYILSEQLYVDWVFKSSFLNAIHNVGYLEKKLNFRSDNLEAYQKYIEEVKPYRTKIRNYTSRYLNIDSTNTNISDFDLPPKYDIVTNTINPVKLGDPEIDLQPWNTWFNNYKFEVTEITLVDQGSTYSSVPQVVITGGGGTGAQAKAYVSSRKVTKIVLTNGGTGYTSVPKVELVGGVGTQTQFSATAVAKIGNSKARLFNNKIKFDRYSKTPTFKSYSSNEKFIENETFTGTGRTTTFDLKYPSTLDKGSIVITVDNEQLFSSDYTVTLYTKLINGINVLKGRLTLLVAIPEGSVLNVKYEKNDEILDSLNRIDKYYKPTDGMLGVDKDIPDDGSEISTDYSQLVTGMDYGGVIVQGATFDIGAGWDALPWFTEGWDSAESNTKDFYIAADDSTHEFVLPEVPESGKVYNIYIRRNGEVNSTRLDDPNFGTPQQTNDDAIMSTFIGDGSTNVITIPTPDEGIYINDGDVLIFRPIDSDGSIDIQSANYIDAEVSGGSLLGLSPYSTATGILPEEIVIDGEKFISPDQVPAPEENIPGQVLESLSIKVFHTDTFGAPSVLSRIYTGDNTTVTFAIDQHILENSSLLVFVNKQQQVDQVDYTIDYSNNLIRFINAPGQGEIIEIFSLGVGGIQLLDVREFTGDGQTRYFLTGATFSSTGRVFATINGVETKVGFVNSNGVVNNTNNTLVEFGVAPNSGDLIQIVVLSEESGQAESIVRVNQERINLTPGTTEYPISFYDQLGSSENSNVIVEYNGSLLRNVDSTYKVFDGETIIKLVNDPVIGSGTVIPTEIKVFVNGEQIENAIDYVFNGASNEVEILKQIDKGDIILIELSTNVNYEIINGTVKFSSLFNITAGDVIDVIWFTQYTEVDILRDVYRGNQNSYKLQRSVNDISSVWVYVNGQRLTPSIDFYVGGNGNAVYIKQETVESDVIQTIVYSNKVYNTPISYEIYRDVLNRNTYSKYQIIDVTLAEDLTYYDTVVKLNDASKLPVPGIGQIGVVSINGEKIQYLNKSGNELRNIRRGFQGTSIKEIHSAGTQVIDTGFTEKVPYSDEQDKIDIVSDGTSLLIGPLDYVPVKGGEFTDSNLPEGYGRCDNIEVFVGGRRLQKDQFKMYDTTKAAYSPDGDVQYDAEFSVDGINEYIRLTDPVAPGTRITIIRRTGRTWYDRGETTVSNGTSLSEATTAVAKFLQNSSTELPE